MKDICGYEGRYAVTSCGKVWSYKSKKFLKPRNYKDYYGVVLGGKVFTIHRLVALTYLPNPENLPEVNHKDENKHNNCINNLEWCTREYNLNYGTRLERQRQKQFKPCQCVETGEIFKSYNDAAKAVGLSGGSVIGTVIDDPIHTRGGYHWKKIQKGE